MRDASPRKQHLILQYVVAGTQALCLPVNMPTASCQSRKIHTYNALLRPFTRQRDAVHDPFEAVVVVDRVMMAGPIVPKRN